MQYQPLEQMRGVWGLDERPYSAEEIAQSFHLQSAMAAGAFAPVAAELSADKPRAENSLAHDKRAAAKEQ